MFYAFTFVFLNNNGKSYKFWLVVFQNQSVQNPNNLSKKDKLYIGKVCLSQSYSKKSLYLLETNNKKNADR
ncbi:hypothetical protein CAPN009_12360 [Capnocytophaga canimorsus]|nr:hypothetical protein CAPN009_12360 [Capnocytophaga canimorsus]